MTKKIVESNEICMDGTLLEDLLTASVVSTDYPSCCVLADENTCCRAFEIDAGQYEGIPVELIRTAVYKAPGEKTGPDT